MSLEKKIVLGFLISALIIAVLVVSASTNFFLIRKEIRYLELSDTVRSKSLQLRRHEKNFFLYREKKETEAVHTYTEELKAILAAADKADAAGRFNALGAVVGEYERLFVRIEALVGDFQAGLERLKPRYREYSMFYPIIESTVLERPMVNARLLKDILSPQDYGPIAGTLYELDGRINDLRKTGEEIVNISKDLDVSARARADKAIYRTQTAGMILLPLFFFIGLSSLFYISANAVRRLNLLTHAIKKTGRGDFVPLALPDEKDEVGTLIKAFNEMELSLVERDREIAAKNEELFKSRKLASLGTLASGVAHELNNPLNNIYLAAQVLSREVEKDAYSEVVKDSTKDIFTQTMRVKRIVGDLLEFSREKPLDLKKVDVVGVIWKVLDRMSASGDTASVRYGVIAPGKVELPIDEALMEQVFINLFSNAVDAMEGRGELAVEVSEKEDIVRIEVSDTGKGIRPEVVQKVFDPFFTTKEKGTGLGLSIVYNIISKHKGKVEVESEPGRGTVFTLSIPKQ